MVGNEHSPNPEGADAPQPPVAPRRRRSFWTQPVSRRESLLYLAPTVISLASLVPSLSALLRDPPKTPEPHKPKKPLGAGPNRPKVGMNYVGWKEGEVGDDWNTSLGQLLDHGVERVIFVPLGFIPPNEIAIRTDTGQTTSAAEIRGAIDIVRHRGESEDREIEVEISPLLICEDGSWRGEYGQGFDQVRRRRFMDAYAGFHQPYIKLAEELGINTYTAGKEMKESIGWEDEWVNFVDNRLRAEYGGPIGYAATSRNRDDEFMQMKLWPLFDEIGISEWGARNQVSWAERISQYLSLGQKYGKPVSLKELGARSIENTGLDPTGDTIAQPWTASEDAQGIFYGDALDTLLPVEGLASLNFWLWNASGRDGDWGTTHSPQDKVAGDYLKRRMDDLHEYEAGR